MILNPNCSEEVFKLIGNVEEVKKEVLKMLDIVESDFASGHRNKAISKARKTIKAIKTLEEFREIAFTFTCNYDTFFRPDHNGISVATCNNHDWTEVNTCHSSEDYYDIAIKRTYNKLKRGKKWVLLEIPKYDQNSTENLNENFPKYLLLESYNKEMVPSLQPRYDFKKEIKLR